MPDFWMFIAVMALIAIAFAVGFVLGWYERGVDEKTRRMIDEALK